MFRQCALITKKSFYTQRELEYIKKMGPKWDQDPSNTTEKEMVLKKRFYKTFELAILQ